MPPCLVLPANWTLTTRSIATEGRMPPQAARQEDLHLFAPRDKVLKALIARQRISFPTRKIHAN